METGSVEEVISAAWDAGRAAWPTVTLERAQLAAFVAPRAENRQFLADLYLAAACMAGDREALAVFEREVLIHARSAIRSIDSNDSFTDEVFQRVRAKLLVADEAAPRIGEYAGRGPLRAWVGITAVRTALMMQRSVRRAREVPAEDDWTDALTMISTNNPELDLLERQYAEAFGAALRDAVAALEPRRAS